MKRKAYATFDEYEADQAAGHQAIIRRLRSFVASEFPALREAIVCGKCFWVAQETPIACVFAAKDHTQFAFGAGAYLRDPKGLLEGASNKYARHVKLRSPADIDEAAFASLLRQAVKVGSPIASKEAPRQSRTPRRRPGQEG